MDEQLSKKVFVEIETIKEELKSIKLMMQDEFSKIHALVENKRIHSTKNSFEVNSVMDVKFHHVFKNCVWFQLMDAAMVMSQTHLKNELSKLKNPIKSVDFKNFQQYLVVYNDVLERAVIEYCTVENSTKKMTINLFLIDKGLKIQTTKNSIFKMPEYIEKIPFQFICIAFDSYDFKNYSKCPDFKWTISDFFYRLDIFKLRMMRKIDHLALYDAKLIDINLENQLHETLLYLRKEYESQTEYSNRNDHPNISNKLQAVDMSDSVKSVIDNNPIFNDPSITYEIYNKDDNNYGYSKFNSTEVSTEVSVSNGQENSLQFSKRNSMDGNDMHELKNNTKVFDMEIKQNGNGTKANVSETSTDRVSNKDADNMKIIDARKNQPNILNMKFSDLLNNTNYDTFEIYLKNKPFSSLVDLESSMNEIINKNEIVGKNIIVMVINSTNIFTKSIKFFYFDIPTRRLNPLKNVPYHKDYDFLNQNEDVLLNEKDRQKIWDILTK